MLNTFYHKLSGWRELARPVLFYMRLILMLAIFPLANATL